jgi:hypothetical protein
MGNEINSRLLTYVTVRLFQSLRYGVGANSRKYDMITVHDYYGPSPSSLGGIDKFALLPSLILQSSDWRRSGRDYGDNFVACDNITEAYADKMTFQVATPVTRYSVPAP